MTAVVVESRVEVVERVVEQAVASPRPYYVAEKRQVRKNQTFEDYLTESEVEEGLKNGTLIEGVLRINPKNYKEAYVTSPDGFADILIFDLRDRNRSLNGDVVIVKIKEDESIQPTGKDRTEESAERNAENKDEEKKKARRRSRRSKTNGSLTEPAQNDGNETPRPVVAVEIKKEEIAEATDGKEVAKILTPTETPEKKTKKRRPRKKTSSSGRTEDNKNEQSGTSREGTSPAGQQIYDLAEKFAEASVSSPVQLITPKKSASLTARKTPAKIKAQVAPSTVPCEANSSNESRRYGKVVFIKEYKHPRVVVGSLRPWDQQSSSQTDGSFTWALFAPKDHRVPRLRLRLKGSQVEFLQKRDYLYVARIVQWHDVQYPLGELGCELGKSGDLEVETMRILTEHDVDCDPHGPLVLAGLPKLPWSIPAEELAKRKDYRNSCIFTIDPPDARDLDDAVFGEYLGTADDGLTKLYRVSVHIADVSYFLNENTPLDQVAANRATSTYLVDRVIPMLPSVLCEHLCSLNPGEDRLAFSVEWTMTDKGEILEEWFGRSVIRSCAKLSYDHAQAIIENRDDVQWPSIASPFTLDDIRRSVLLLQDIATVLRTKRFRQGALRIDLPKLHFVMDWETRTPLGCRVYELKDSNRLIEELMLLANTRVAEKLYSSFPDVAVLRSHPPPQLRMLQQLADNLAAVGIHLDISSSAAVQSSIWRLAQCGSSSDITAYARYLVICNMLAKPMKCAQYICSGMTKSEQHFRHYALSVPFYTHFTSPIRRYADVLVHRLLAAALGYQTVAWNPADVKKQLDNCNDRKLAAKDVQELHTSLHFAALLRRCGPVEAKAVVQAVLDHSVDVIIIHLGIAKRVYLDKLPLAELRYEQANSSGSITLLWEPDENGFQLTQFITQFSVVDVVIVPDAELQFNVTLKRSSPSL